MRPPPLRIPRHSALALLSWALLSSSGYAQQLPATAPASELLSKLRALPGVISVQPVQARGRGNRGGGAGAATAPAAAPTRETYELLFEQPISHANPALGKFQQRVFIAFSGDYSKPVLLGTEGYASNGVGGGELQSLLAGNQVTVEHRYFGRSIPSLNGATPWEHLTVKNAADDMHAIVSTLKSVYPGKWVATGTSKGGQTALFYKCYYPDDVHATVAYVAPVNITQEDPRINRFIETVGDAPTRAKIKQFQIALLKREPELLPLVKAAADRSNWTFSMGFEKAYEYGVLEYPYAFWQGGINASEIPAPDASAETLANHYNRVGTLRYYGDQGKRQFEAFQYQAFTEIGYYNYDITDFKSFLKHNPEPTNLDICPDGTKEKIRFNPVTMDFVFHALQYKASNIIFIYGELDAWAATQMQLIGRTNSLKFVVPGAHHGARISALPPDERTRAYTTLESWLDLKLNRPQ
jgi:pimeloyl-ACP methyl ester carboxylesterase